MQEATWDREDYRELLELVFLYLGVVKRVHKGEIVPVNPVTIGKPGTVNRARFMASSLHHINIYMYR